MKVPFSTCEYVKKAAHKINMYPSVILILKAGRKRFVNRKTGFQFILSKLFEFQK